MYICIIAVIILILDRVSKLWVVDHFYLGESVPLIPNVFHFTYILNKGAAFGILVDQKMLFLAIVALMLVVLWAFRKKVVLFPLWAKAGIGILVGGALGNAYDRYANGAVIDFFDFRIWPIFNVADIAICIGVAIIAYYLWRTNES